MYLDLKLCKKQIELEGCYVDDDDFVLYLMDLAEERVAKELCVKVEDLATIGGGEVISPTLVHAMMLYVATYFKEKENTTSANTKEFPDGSKALIALDRDYSL